MGKTKKETSRKIHKSYYSFGSSTSCGITAYSPEHIKEFWKGVTCKNCLKLKKGGRNSSQA